MEPSEGAEAGTWVMHRIRLGKENSVSPHLSTTPCVKALG